MKKQTMMRLIALLLCLTLGGSLAGCCADAYEEGYRSGYAGAIVDLEQQVYDRGYAKGFADGAASVPEVPDQAPADAVTEDTVTEDTVDYAELGFVLVTDVIPDAILEIRYYSTFNFVGERIQGYEAPVAYLTREAAEALKGVSDELMARGYRIKIYDAYRPQRAVDHFREWAQDPEDTAMQPWFYPELDKSLLYDKGYIARRSGHSRGSTVDLTMVDMVTGREVDMGGGFDYFGALSHPSYTSTLTQEQITNRKILRAAMVNHGFRPLASEWWHFTLENEPYPDTYFDFPVTMPQN